MNTIINNLGECIIDSPLVNIFPSKKSFFVSDGQRVIYNCYINNDCDDDNHDINGFEAAGPREKIYFDPAQTCSAIVTCGGLSPGLNNVIRSIVMESYYRYKVKSILGIRFGYSGLNPKNNYNPMQLTPQIVRDIHLDGGTILGSSRGGVEDMELLVDRIEELGINILYAIGGDGTIKGALKLADIIKKRRSKISIIGIPKTIDNDISYIQRTFGFESAVAKAVDAIYSAHIEAEGAQNGIGLVKLMGRHSGFIAANAALAMNDVNYLLVPEVRFDLYGENGLFAHLKERLKRRSHAVICVAEGAGQEHLVKDKPKEYDASGNPVLEDIGNFLKDKINDYFKKEKIKINLKYIDPSYMIRSTPANSNDAIFCTMLGQYAVHAGMAGKTSMIIGLWNNVYTHVPMELVISESKQIDPNSRFWYNIMAATGQPVDMTNKESTVS
ncbi:MAG: ATP-dependent 6-phosphofructokinase [Spirochaetes bacterium]|nr:ATP-dependent 6-phosphofructokinase [Spirochaetota bacterium]